MVARPPALTRHPPQPPPDLRVGGRAGRCVSGSPSIVVRSSMRYIVISCCAVTTTPVTCRRPGSAQWMQCVMQARLMRLPPSSPLAGWGALLTLACLLQASLPAHSLVRPRRALVDLWCRGLHRRRMRPPSGGNRHDWFRRSRRLCGAAPVEARYGRLEGEAHPRLRHAHAAGPLGVAQRRVADR